MAEHLEIDEFQQSCSLEICCHRVNISISFLQSHFTDPYPALECLSGILSSCSEYTPSHCLCGSADLE
jgi:hypothetical protein